MSNLKKIGIGIIATLGLGVLFSAAFSAPGLVVTPTAPPIIQYVASPTTTLVPATVPAVTRTATPVVIKATPTATPTTSTTGLSNNNYYTNVSGNEVHSPAHSNTVPVGASAQCGDGTYSFSQHRSGTCSHHGGVAEWL